MATWSGKFCECGAEKLQGELGEAWCIACARDKTENPKQKIALSVLGDEAVKRGMTFSDAAASSSATDTETLSRNLQPGRTCTKSP